MKLYHFTRLRQLIGEAGLEAVEKAIEGKESVNAADFAVPGSILEAGLIPAIGEASTPIFTFGRPALWFTTAPTRELTAEDRAWVATDPKRLEEVAACGGKLFGNSDPGFRLTLKVPSSKHLVPFAKWYRVMAANMVAVDDAGKPLPDAPPFPDLSTAFSPSCEANYWVSFKRIPARCIVAVEAMSKEAGL